MAEVSCDRCLRRIPRKFLANHQAGLKCAADTLARELLDRGLVPYPPGHSLPECIPIEAHRTRAVYEGVRFEPSGAPSVIESRPRGAKDGTGLQYWAPAWVRAVTEAWARPTATWRAEWAGRRDGILLELLTMSEDIHQAILTAASVSDEAVVRLALELCRGSR
jgi:hypothetical protein